MIRAAALFAKPLEHYLGSPYAQPLSRTRDGNKLDCLLIALFSLVGTFDRIHAGHKLLIGAAALFATKKLTVGIANGRLLEGKTLEELIEPVEKRIQNVKELIDDLKPGMHKRSFY